MVKKQQSLTPSYGDDHLLLSPSPLQLPLSSLPVCQICVFEVHGNSGALHMQDSYTTGFSEGMDLYHDVPKAIQLILMHYQCIR